MNIKRCIIGSALLFLFSTATYADKSYIRYDFVNLSVDDSIDKANPSAFQISLGVPLSHHLSMEATTAVGINDDEFGSGYTTKLKSIYGGFIKGSVPLGQGHLYGRAGLVGIEVEVNAVGSSGETYDDSGLGFGVGIEMPLMSHSALLVEYTSYPEIKVNRDIDIEVTGASIGIKSEF